MKLYKYSKNCNNANIYCLSLGAKKLPITFFFFSYFSDEDDQNISDDDENVQVNSNRKFDKGGLNGLSTVYKIGSKPDLRSGSDYKVVDDFSTVQPEKPNLIFGKSESVIDDEGKKIVNVHFWF